MVKNLSETDSCKTDGQKYSRMFQLRNRRRQIMYQADFTPVKALSQSRGKKILKQFSIIPTFNNDKKFYSEAFYNPFQGPEIDRNSLVKHQEMVKEISTQIPRDSILLPKPRRKNHCWVCHCEFDDYLQHIKSQDHKQCINASKFNKDIMSLAKIYQHFNQIKVAKNDRQTVRNRTKTKKIVH